MIQQKIFRVFSSDYGRTRDELNDELSAGWKIISAIKIKATKIKIYIEYVLEKEITQRYIKFNINDYILIKITAAGWAYLRCNFDKDYIKYSIIPYKVMIKGEAWHRLQLHEVCSLFPARKPSTFFILKYWQIQPRKVERIKESWQSGNAADC